MTNFFSFVESNTIWSYRCLFTFIALTPKRPFIVGSVKISVLYSSSIILYVICCIIAVAFSSLIRAATLIINSSGLFLNCSKVVDLIPCKICIIAFLVSSVSSTSLPIKSYFIFELDTDVFSCIADPSLIKAIPLIKSSLDFIFFIAPVSTFK